MKIRSLFIIFLITVIIPCCISPFGVIHCSDETVEFSGKPIGTFSQLEFQQACHASITAGDSYSVVIVISENISNHLDIDKEGQLVRFSLHSGYTYENLTFKVSITMPVLKSVHAGGASTVALSGFETSDGFSAELSGASKLDGDLECGPAAFTLSGASTLTGTITCSDMTLDLSGASRIETDGKARNISCEASGASTVKMRNQRCGDMSLNLSGASSMHASPSGAIHGELSGASVFYYYGSPTVGKFDLSGGSTVRKAD